MNTKLLVGLLFGVSLLQQPAPKNFEKFPDLRVLGTVREVEKPETDTATLAPFKLQDLQKKKKEWRVFRTEKTLWKTLKRGKLMGLEGKTLYLLAKHQDVGTMSKPAKAYTNIQAGIAWGGFEAPKLTKEQEEQRLAWVKGDLKLKDGKPQIKGDKIFCDPGLEVFVVEDAPAVEVKKGAIYFLDGKADEQNLEIEATRVVMIEKSLLANPELKLVFPD